MISDLLFIKIEKISVNITTDWWKSVHENFSNHHSTKNAVTLNITNVISYHFHPYYVAYIFDNNSTIISPFSKSHSKKALFIVKTYRKV